MDRTFLLSEFDRLVRDGLVLYDDKQTILRQLDGGLKFQFVLTSALNKKPTAATAATQSAERLEKRVLRPGSDIDTHGYEVAEVGPGGSHVLAANKFCYARPHYLLLTRDGHRRQHERLDRADLAAAWALLSSSGGGDLDDFAVFFNCGEGAGYSRLHKHMQLMPMPRHTFAAFLDTPDGAEPELPFRWFYRRLADVGIASLDRVVDSYRALLEKATSSVVQSRRECEADDSPGAACSHNVILTSRWIVVIPRRRPSVRGESGANSMGMLGYIAVSSQEDIDTWTDQGLCNVLHQLGVPN